MACVTYSVTRSLELSVWNADEWYDGSEYVIAWEVNERHLDNPDPWEPGDGIWLASDNELDPMTAEWPIPHVTF